MTEIPFQNDCITDISPICIIDNLMPYGLLELDEEDIAKKGKLPTEEASKFFKPNFYINEEIAKGLENIFNGMTPASFWLDVQKHYDVYLKEKCREKYVKSIESALLNSIKSKKG